MLIDRKKEISVGIALCFFCILTWTVLHAVTGKSMFGASAYNTYTRQALSWLQGRTDVDECAYLELAIFSGRYYVSFPPLPSVVLLPFAALSGINTPDNLLVMLYALAAAVAIYGILCHAGYSVIPAAVWSYLFCMGSSLLPLTLEGAVWYHAQVLGFSLTVISIAFLTQDRLRASLFCYALSVGCRPFQAVYGIPLAVIYLSIEHDEGKKTIAATLKKAVPGIIAGLAVAIALGAYNYFRFGNPLEFGHNYLPEFSFQGGTQFAFRHIAGNLKKYLFGLPFYLDNGTLQMDRFGFTVWLACPVLLCMMIWIIRDLFLKRMEKRKAAIAIAFLVHFALLLSHRTFGGFQYGARYCVDLMPYALMYRLCSRERNRICAAEWIWLGAGWVTALYGSVIIHL